MLVLIPMALDRLIAVSFPFKYKSFVTYKVSLTMAIISWIPSVAVGINDAITFLLGKYEVNINIKDIIYL